MYDDCNEPKKPGLRDRLKFSFQLFLNEHFSKQCHSALALSNLINNFWNNPCTVIPTIILGGQVP